MMTREAHAQVLASILEGSADRATTSEAVTTLSEDYAAALADSSVLGAKVAALETENARLIDQNMKLFLKVGSVPPPEPEQKDEPNLTFENLFDADGNLK